jgi:hypothetical protein
VDSVETKKDTIASKSRENMTWLLDNFAKQLEDTIIITVANKQDMEDAMDIQDIGNAWVKDKKLMAGLDRHDWRIFPCSSLSGEGLDGIYRYIASKLNHRLQRTSCQRSSTTSIGSSRITMSRDLVTPWESVPNPHHLSDHEFHNWFYAKRQFLFFDHWALLRIIYLSAIIKKKKKSWGKLLSYLEYCLKILPTSESVQYSETQTLFWIQMVSFALLKSPVLEGEDNGFHAFLVRCRLDEECWKIYYSQKVFYSENARKEFLPPDKKPLPNAFKSSSLALKGSGLRIDYQVL